MQLVKIDTTDPNYGFVEGLLHEAFPENERRDAPQQREYTDSNHLFHVLLAVDEDKPVGFISYWDFDDFRYVEHFAIDAQLRCKGYGQEILRTFMGMAETPIVLEVEMPEEEMNQRRIIFYARQGLDLWRMPYAQPPYRKGDSYIPMMIMASPTLDMGDYNRIKDTIHREVYGVGK